MEVLRSPESRFAHLPGFAFEPHHVQVDTIDGTPLRMHYVDEGPRDAPVVLMLHGEPTWSYLYRKMIPPIVDAGLRAVAPDHIGFGRSDKPAERTAYTFARHIAWLQAFLLALDLRDITLVAQDWGGPIGLGALGRAPERFARAVAANTMLHTLDPALDGRLRWSATTLPGGDSRIAAPLLDWIVGSQRAPGLRASDVIAGACTSPLPGPVRAAYDAPFPGEPYKAGMRQFPVLIPVTRDDPGAALNLATWKALRHFERPFLTAFSDGDPSTAGWAEVFVERVPGARGQPHTVIEGAGHFLQEDRGEALARVVVDFIGA